MTSTSWMQLKSIALHVEGEPLPRLWPVDASASYIEARRALVETEMALRDQVEEVARLRRSLPRGATIADYALSEGPLDLQRDEPVETVSVRDLFGDHQSLFVYHLMFHPDDDQACPMCSMWVDGLHGVSHHITRRAALGVVGKAPLDKLRRWARYRGWNGLRIVSSDGTTFNTDLDVEGVGGGQWPAVSVFTRDGDEVRHVITQTADYPNGTNRGIDMLSPVWHVLDLVPEGRGEWMPDNDYPTDRRGEV
jgi:predicted dithiol-disulfide oxidoreductase (DUF899 family)